MKPNSEQHFEVLTAIREQGEATARAIDKLTAAIEQLTLRNGNGNGDKAALASLATRLGDGAKSPVVSSSIVLGIVTLVGALVWTPVVNRLSKVEDKLEARINDTSDAIRNATKPIYSQLGGLRKELHEDGARLARLTEHQNEIESQIRSLGAFMNEYEQNDQQRDSMVWEKVMGQPVPPRSHWPSFGRTPAGQDDAP